MGLAMGMQHAIKAALRTDIQAAIGKDRHDLSRRQCCELRLVTGQKDALALLVGEAVRHQAVAAFTAVQAVPITRELPAPALQCGESHAQQVCHLLSSSPGRHGGIEDLQCLAAILGRAQSTSSSPQ